MVGALKKFKTINFEVKDSIAFISFLKPKLNREALKELRIALANLVGVESLDGVILHGNTDFCARGEPKELKGLSYTNAREFSKLGQDTFLLLNKIDVPCIAAIEGNATGPGFELALACDVRIAANNAVLGHCQEGHPPCFGGSVRLSRIIGPNAADQLVRSQRKLSALEAHHLGLVDYVVDKKTLLFEAEQVIRNEGAAKSDFRQDDFQEEQEAFARVVGIAKKAEKKAVPPPVKARPKKGPAKPQKWKRREGARKFY